MDSARRESAGESCPGLRVLRTVTSSWERGLRGGSQWRDCGWRCELDGLGTGQLMLTVEGSHAGGKHLGAVRPLHDCPLRRALSHRRGHGQNSRSVEALPHTDLIQPPLASASPAPPPTYAQWNPAASTAATLHSLPPALKSCKSRPSRRINKHLTRGRDSSPLCPSTAHSCPRRVQQCSGCRRSS